MKDTLPDKARFSQTELARAINKHVSTVVRWTLRGVRGHILKSYLLGGQRYIDRQDYLDFIQGLNVASTGPSPVSVPDREEQISCANEELDRAGI
jgi:hypothetical protein